MRQKELRGYGSPPTPLKYKIALKLRAPDLIREAVHGVTSGSLLPILNPDIILRKHSDKPRI